MLGELLFLFALILLGGIFAMAEIALVSVRRSRLEQLADEGNKNAQIALELTQTPERFLSAVQCGITLIGTFAGAVGGVTLSDDLKIILSELPLIGHYAEPISFFTVVLGITYITLVLGELVPKSVALSYTEQIALLFARPMRFFMKLTFPFIHVLSGSTSYVTRLLGIKKGTTTPEVTQDEIEFVIDQGAESGALGKTEHRMVEGVFRLGDRSIGLLMTPRKDVVWLDVNDPIEESLRKIEQSRHSHFPVGDGSLDTVLGMISVKDLFQILHENKLTTLRENLTPPLYVPDSLPALRVLHQFKEHGTHIAIVLDEYGSFEGIVTLNDFMGTIIGDDGVLQVEGDEPMIVTRPDGSWLVDGGTAIDELRDLLGVSALFEEERGEYYTLAGMLLALLGRIPSIGDSVAWENFSFEIVDMDGNRIDRVLIAKLPEVAVKSE